MTYDGGYKEDGRHTYFSGWMVRLMIDQYIGGQELSNYQRQQLQQIMTEFSKVLQNKPGRTKLVEHKIETDTSCPKTLPPYRLPQAYQGSVQKEIQEMSEQNIIEPSSSEWAVLIVLVKKDGSLRLCVNYQ